MKSLQVRHLLLLLVIALVAGCGGTQEKDERSAEVVDGTDSGESMDGDAEGGASASGAGEAGKFSGDALDDPSSPLSQRSIYFDYDSSEIRSEYRPIIEAHAEYLAQNSDTRVTLEGNTDERGSREYNLALGERRAESVKRQMVLLGASAGQIKVVSYGEERPVADGHDEEAWRLNRRVDIVY
ncbi:peptidoglycan-associated lipoprotein [Methylohalomonas lacus]|uniref:Peptidoglycan-associated lipoprotein n=1 Tax=Methylohalomonas lacus TaxID=398773 RepID=A0AAE3HKU3_9GAMM|nr:peptidoglycan-associated lipoprotein Pal [Methylohalomonas lacus]MCS3904191.1 peptidoglycan-associated lipoprotein [Methylohalomonas lacus]